MPWQSKWHAVLWIILCHWPWNRIKNWMKLTGKFRKRDCSQFTMFALKWKLSHGLNHINGLWGHATSSPKCNRFQNRKFRSLAQEKNLNLLCLTAISSMFSIKSKICQTSGGQEKFASNLIFDFLMKTELFWWEI